MNFLRTLVQIPKRIARDWLNIITRRTYRPLLIPVAHLRALDKTGQKWEATGADPQFLVGGLMPLGFLRVSVTASSDRPATMGFYLDFGQGFNQSTFISVGVLTAKPRTYQTYLPLRPRLRSIRFDPTDTAGKFELDEIYFQRITLLELLGQLVWRWMRRTHIHPREILFTIESMMQVWRARGLRGISRMVYSRFSPGSDVYEEWLERHALTQSRIAQITAQLPSLAYRPLISILMPVYNTDEQWLREALDSVLAQLYPHWELCIADDASTEAHVRQVLSEYQARDGRIKVVWRPQNGHISAASNSALEIAAGEFVATLDHDDRLQPDALFEVVALLDRHPEADMIYSDEDKISETGHRFIHYFKPDWSPDLFLSQMYTAHLAVYRKDLIEAIGGYRIGFEGAQDYDLVLRLSEQTRHIHHIPRVLYSWRRTAGSTAQHARHKIYAYQAAEKALSEAIQRRGRPASVEHVPGYPGHFRVLWTLQGRPLVSIIILTRDKADLLERCLTSIFEKTDYPNFEVILVDNGSQEDETQALIESWREREPKRFRCERREARFNFSALNNFGVKIARGEICLLLNNDTEVISPDWLERMAAQAQRPEIGAVGAMLLFPDYTIQHAGIVLGIGEWAGHSHKGLPVDDPGYNARLLGPSNYAAVTGACLMMRRDLYLQLGGLEEKLAVACGDVELCLKALDAGLYNVVLPDVQLLHYESATRGYEVTSAKRRRFLREVNFVKERWPDTFLRDPFYNPNLTRTREDFSLNLEE